MEKCSTESKCSGGMKCHKIIKMISALLVLAIGICMLVKYDIMTPPGHSGLAFILIGINLWIPHCPFLKCLTKSCKK